MRLSLYVNVNSYRWLYNRERLNTLDGRSFCDISTTIMLDNNVKMWKKLIIIDKNYIIEKSTVWKLKLKSIQCEMSFITKAPGSKMKCGRSCID